MTMARTLTNTPPRPHRPFGRRLLPLFGLALLLPFLGSSSARAQESLHVDMVQSVGCAGDWTLLEAVVSGGTGPYVYQWSRQRIGETSFTDIAAGTSNELIIDFVTRDQNGDLYQVLVTDGDGALGSDATTLAVPPLHVLHCPHDRSGYLPNGCGQVPVPDLTSEFYFCGTGTVTQDPPAGALVGPGHYGVELTVTGDPSTNPGEIARCVVFFHVVGVIPILDCPASVEAVLPGNDCQVAAPDIRPLVAVTYPCGEVTLSQDPAPGTLVGVGTHRIKVTATGANDSLGTGFTVLSVTSTMSLPGPAPLIARADAGQCTAAGLSPTAPKPTGGCGSADVAGRRSDGQELTDPYPVGDTTITWTATDSGGSTTSCQQTVIVSDEERPTITGPPLVSVSTDVGTCTASGVALGTPTTADNCGVATVTNDAPAAFALGETTITWTVTDIHGNTNTGAQTVTVKDVAAPTISGLSATPNRLGPANHRLVDITVNYTLADNCGTATPTLTASSNEPDNGLGDGDMPGDIQIVDAHHLKLRAERSGKGKGREYTITVRATDGAGNQTSQSVTVKVP
jgi:hypothetical protein